MKKIVLFVLCFFLGFSTFAQYTIVNSDGSVTIKSNVYTNSEIQREDNNGNWNSIGNLQNGVLTDNDVDANSSSVRYRLILDTEPIEFSTIYCIVAEKPEDNTKLQIKWTAVSAFEDTYSIYRRLSTETDFTLLATLPSLDGIRFEDDKLSACAIEYKIEAQTPDISTGTSVSNIAEFAKQDNSEPASVSLLPINIDKTSQQVEITWTSSQSSDTWGYVVCKQDESGKRQPLDTVYGINTTNYTCQQCDIHDTNYITVFAFDSCMNTSPLSQTYNNIVLTMRRESCDEPLQLSWNSYSPTDDAHSYAVMVSTDGGQTYNAETITSETSYVMQLPVGESTISFYVQSNYQINTPGSSSNILTLNTEQTDTLDYVYLENASVSEDNLSVTLTAHLDATKIVQGYHLWRQMDDEDFVMVKEIPYSGYEYVTFEDQLDFSASEHNYTYYLAAPDECGGSYTYSNRISPMRLVIDASAQPKIKLTWVPYRPANWTPTKYNIYRFAENNIQNAELIATSVANSYIDNTEDMVSATDRTFYYVQAVSSTEYGPNGSAYTANSSNSYAKFESIFFIPNAFAPKDGQNTKINTFKPACHFVRSGSYTMKIYTRTGTLLFETNNPDEGWDGTYKDEVCPVGTYVYKIQYIDSDGMEQNKGGAFLLYD